MEKLGSQRQEHMQAGYKSYRQVSDYLVMGCITNLVCPVGGVVVINWITVLSAICMRLLTNLTEPIVTPDFSSNVSFTSLG